MTEPRQTAISLPIQVAKGWGKQGQYVATLGPVSGYGRTLADAKAALAENIAGALSNAATEPAFARDDDGSLVVAVQDMTGVAHWVIRDDKPRQITYCDGPPRKSLEGCHHYTLLGDPS